LSRASHPGPRRRNAHVAVRTSRELVAACIRSLATQQGDGYPAGPPTIEEMVAVMHRAGGQCPRRPLRGLIVVLGERSLRINEALALAEANLDPRRGSLLVRRAKGDRVAKSGCTIGPGSSSRSG
jgi:hypothetical protein